MQKRQDPEILAILAETPLAALIDILRAGEFQPVPDDPVGVDEVVIDELTEIEKALFLSCRVLVKKADTIAESNNQMVTSAEQRGQKTDDLQVYLNKAEHKALAKMIEGLSAALWCSIKKRSGIPSEGKNVLGIRYGYKLVAFSREVGLGEMLAEMLMDDDVQLAVLTAGVDRRRQ